MIERAAEGKLEGPAFSINKLKTNLPPGELTEVDARRVPKAVLDRLFEDCDAEGRFKTFFLFKDATDADAYITAEPSWESGQNVGARAYVVYLSGKKVIGHGTVSHYWDREERHGWEPVPESLIDDDRQGEGLGVRLYEILNACSQGWFGKPMHASGGPSSDGEFNALRVWRRLVKDGKARYENGNFVFNEKKLN